LVSWQTVILVSCDLKCQCPLCAGVPGDGRCLFRSVAHGACLRFGKRAPSESLQRELADDLRSNVFFLCFFILIMRSATFCFGKKHHFLLPHHLLSFYDFAFFSWSSFCVYCAIKRKINISLINCEVITICLTKEKLHDISHYPIIFINSPSRAC
jgi:hypothetical protein